MFEEIVAAFEAHLGEKTNWSSTALKDITANVIGDVSQVEQWSSPILFGQLMKEFQRVFDVKTGWGRNQIMQVVMMTCIRVADRRLKELEGSSLSRRNIIP